MINDILKEFRKQFLSEGYLTLEEATLVEFFLKSALERCLDEAKLEEITNRKLADKHELDNWLAVDGYNQALKDLSAKISELKS